MATTTPRQVVYDIASGYKTATGDTTEINYGNITEKVLGAIGGGGVEITDITLNADGTYTVTDKDNNTHTLEVTETDGQITAITYDGDNVPLSFSNGELTGVGDTDIDVSRYPDSNIGYKVTFKVDGDDYYVASCQQGKSITEPPSPIEPWQGRVQWKDTNNNVIVFPYTPVADIELTSVFVSASFLVHFDNSVQDEGDATATNAQGIPTYATGKFGQAIVGDGHTTIKYQSDTAFKYDATTSPFTLEFWVNCSTNDYYSSVFGFADSAPSNNNGLIYANGNEVGLYKGDRKIYANNVGTNAWHHIAFVFISTGSKIFVDGELKASNNFVYNTGTSNIASLMGNGNSGLEMLGGAMLDEFAIFPYEKYTENFTPPTQPY